jgi:hypothetical protein
MCSVTLASVTDYDDVNTISMAEMLQREDIKVTNATQPHWRTVEPYAAMAAYGSGVFTSYASRKSPWIDCASTAVEHYGIKFLATATTSGTIDAQWRVMTKIFVEFRNVR